MFKELVGKLGVKKTHHCVASSYEKIGIEKVLELFFFDKGVFYDEIRDYRKYYNINGRDLPGYLYKGGHLIFDTKREVFFMFCPYILDEHMKKINIKKILEINKNKKLKTR